MVNKKLINVRIIFTYLFLLSFFCFLLFSCSTQPQSGSLTGTILLDGQEDHSNIIVAVYELSELDPDIVAINKEYPHIGVIINQHTEFDHRFANLTKYTHTDANGNFKINDIPTGRYNFMAMKDGFGFKYIYEISITEGDNFIKRQKVSGFAKLRHDRKGKRKNDETPFNLSPLTFNLNKSEADIILYPETIIKEDITENTVFESFHHYIVTPEYSNYLEISGDLTIEPGAVIRIEKDKKLTISGDLTAIGDEDNFIWFTSNDPSEICSQAHISRGRLMTNPTFAPAPDSINYYNRVELIGNSDKEMAFCKFDHAGTGLLNNVNGFSISDCIFRNSACGFKSEGVDSTFCSNLLCEDITNASEAGIYFINVDSGIIEENVTNFCKIGIQIKDGSSPIVKNNYINNSTHSVDISWNSYPDIFYNVLKNSETAISVTRSSCPNIFNNNINAGIGVIRGHYSGTISMDIHNNNLNCSNYSIYLKENHNYSGCGIDVNAENNYFYTTNEDEIQASIHDKNDIEPSQQQYYGIVYYDPPLHQEYPYAGIQGE